MSMQAGETGQELINQGLRDTVIVAVLGEQYLYEYEMPNGTTALRNQRGKAVPYTILGNKWIRAIDEQFGIYNLICNPQKGNRNIRTTIIQRAERMRQEAGEK